MLMSVVFPMVVVIRTVSIRLEASFVNVLEQDTSWSMELSVLVRELS